MRYEDSLELRINVWLDVWICESCEAQAHVPRRPNQRDRITPVCPNPDCAECPASKAYARRWAEFRQREHWSREPAERAVEERGCPERSHALNRCEGCGAEPGVRCRKRTGGLTRPLYPATLCSRWVEESRSECGEPAVASSYGRGTVALRRCREHAREDEQIEGYRVEWDAAGKVPAPPGEGLELYCPGCDRGSWVAPGSVDVTTTGYTDVRCDGCGAQMRVRGHS